MAQVGLPTNDNPPASASNVLRVQGQVSLPSSSAGSNSNVTHPTPNVRAEGTVEDRDEN